MTSSLIRISNELLLEFFYEEKEYKLQETLLKRIDNKHENSITFYDEFLTNNLSKYTVLNTNTENVFFNEGGYYYPDSDVNILVKDFSSPSSIIPPTISLKYNSIKCHIMSGYQFGDTNGINITLYTEGENKKLISLCNYMYLKSHIENIKYNSRPVKISEAVFDRYFEFDILSLEYLIKLQQTSHQTSTELLGCKILENHKLYIETAYVNQLSYDTGYLTFTLVNNKKMSMSSVNNYNQINNFIALSKDNSYFEFQARYADKQIEDFIYQLNSIPGNNFYLNHEIKVIEQVGQSFIEQDTYFLTQRGNYSRLFKFRPVLYNKNTVSVSIDYKISLINEVDGIGIAKSGSITSTNVSAFQDKLIKLNLSGIDAPMNVFNKVMSSSRNQLIDNKFDLIKTKVIKSYISKEYIGLEEDKPIKISPFKNAISLSFVDKSVNTPKAIDYEMSYFLTFIKKDGSKLYVKEVIMNGVEKKNGELVFELEESQSMEIISTISDNRCYVIAKDGKTESIFAKLQWIID